MAENLSNSDLPTNPPPQPAFKRITGARPKKGDLVGFNYMFWKRDPYPLVLVTSVYTDGKVAGVNLHNLTLNDMINLVSKYCNKAGLSYQSAVKGRREIARGFRTYKWEGVRNAKVLNCEMFLNSLGIARQARFISPNEVAKMRQLIQQQLRGQVNPSAEHLTRMTTPTTPARPASIPGNPASVPGIPTGRQGE